MNNAAIRNEHLGLKAGVLALAASLLWGGNSVFIKLGLQGIPPLAMAGLRFALGALTVWLGAFFLKVPLRPQAGEWRGLGALSLLFVVQIGLLNQGTDFTSANRSTILMSAYPFFTALFAHFLIPGDRLDTPKVIGLVLSFSGLALIFGESLHLDDTHFLLGDLLVLSSALLLGLRQIGLKWLVHNLHPFKVIFWQAILSLPLFAVASALWERDAIYRLSPPILGAVLYQGIVVAGLCFILWTSLLQNHSASRLVVFSFITPVFGVWLSTLVLGETVSTVLIGGLLLVTTGIVIVNRKTPR